MRLGSLIKVFEDTSDDAILIDLGGRTDMQCWGSVLAAAAAMHGVRAALVNGAVRDAAGLAEMGFPTFARGVHPASVRGRLELAAVGCDVLIDGQPVSSGWAVAADSNGAVFFPREFAGKVLDLAAETATAERQLLDRFRDTSQPAAVLDMLIN